MKIEIKSITDVITNSSTEAFTIIPPDSVETIKKAVNELIKLAGVPFTFDDLFEIEQVGFSQREVENGDLEYYCNVLGLDPSTATPDEVLKRSRVPGAEYESLMGGYHEGYPATDQKYVITPKLGEYGDAAVALQEMLNGTFDAIWSSC